MTYAGGASEERVIVLFSDSRSMLVVDERELVILDGIPKIFVDYKRKRAFTASGVLIPEIVEKYRAYENFGELLLEHYEVPHAVASTGHPERTVFLHAQKELELFTCRDNPRIIKRTSIDRGLVVVGSGADYVDEHFKKHYSPGSIELIETIVSSFEHLEQDPLSNSDPNIALIYKEGGIVTTENVTIEEIDEMYRELLKKKTRIRLE